MKSGETIAGNTSHWGAFNAIVQDGRLVDVTPFAGDKDPSPMLATIPVSYTHLTLPTKA